MGPPRKSRAIKTRLLTAAALDGRTRARRQFDAIAKGIAADLGGEDSLSTVQQHLVEAFAGAACHVHDLNARLLKGDKVDILAHSQAVSMMVRLASHIGVVRIPRVIEAPTLDDIAREIDAEKATAVTIEAEEDDAT